MTKFILRPSPFVSSVVEKPFPGLGACFSISLEMNGGERANFSLGFAAAADVGGV
jgi:hypothetical protein